jgi:hypothetical protein
VDIQASRLNPASSMNHIQEKPGFVIGKAMN